MKYLRHILLILSALYTMLLASCVRENLRELNPAGAEDDGEYVTLNMSIEMMAETDQGVWTKALGETPEVKDLYVAVFDKGDILTEIVKAEPGTVEDPRDVFEPGTAGNQYLTRFHVTLKRTSESRELQFIAIGKKNFIDVDDFDMIDEASFIKKFIVTDNVDAYWCRKHFDGISAASSAGMQGLKMVRNFLKVSVSLKDGLEDTFELRGFKVFNKPRYGTLAPYNPNTEEYLFDASGNASVNFNRFADYSMVEGNEEDTANLAYKELVNTQKYTGYMPSLVEYITMAEEVNGAAPDTWFDANKITPGGYDYLYECTFTSVANPYIIFKGRYKGTGAKGRDTYYKADFVYQENAEADKFYFHLLRNFFYELRISSVGSDGADTLEEAVNSPSMNNFDGSSESHTYTVISKAGARLYISSTDMLVTDGTQVKIYLKNLTGDAYDVLSPGDITVSKVTPCINVKDINKAQRLTPLVTYTPGDEAYRTAINADDFDPENSTYVSNYSIVRSPGSVTFNGSEGWVEYTINLSRNPNTLGDNEMWQQEITFSNGEGGLTRTLTLSGMKPYDFDVDVQDYVPGVEGETMSVDIILPSGISQARFPLKFFIESDAHTIYPDATSAAYPTLPVSSGSSFIPNKSERSYWFIRTITYEEYLAAHEDVQANKTFTSYFKTLVPASATTVYVKSDPETTNYFSGLRSDSFVNERIEGHMQFEKSPLYVAVGSKAINPVTVNSGAPVSYSIQNVAIATVNATTGEVIGVSPGETVVTATIPQYKAYTGYSTTFTVKVADFLPDWTFGWDGLLTPVINKDQTVTRNTATATVVKSNETLHPTVTYTSSDTGIATVDANGHVTGVSAGTVVITAHAEIAEFTDGGHTYSAMSENLRYEIEVVVPGVSSPTIGTEYVNVPFYDGKIMWFTKSHEATVLGADGFDAWNFRTDDVRYGMQASAWDYSANCSRNSHSWLISPVLDLRASVNPVLEFNHSCNYFMDGFTGNGTHGENGVVYVPALSESAGNLDLAKARVIEDCLVHISFDGGANWSDGTLLTEAEYPDGYNWVSVNVSHSLKPLLAGKTAEQLMNVRIGFEYKASPEYFPADLTEYRPWGGTWQIKSFKVVEGLNNNP